VRCFFCFCSFFEKRKRRRARRGPPTEILSEFLRNREVSVTSFFFIFTLRKMEKDKQGPPQEKSFWVAQKSCMKNMF
jgi:hypothetical protein